MAIGFNPIKGFCRVFFLLRFGDQTLQSALVPLTQNQRPMKKTLTILSVLAAALLLSPAGFAADKEVTLKGEGKCAKCSLKETTTCQNVVVVKEGDKSVTYYIDHDAVAKAFHSEVCTETKAISVTGVVKEVGGKKTIDATKITAGK